MTEKTILYLLSTSYAGSHFLSLMLGSNSRAMHIGEAKRLRKPRETSGKSACYICGDEGICPVLSGVRHDDIGEIYASIFSRLDGQVTTLVDTSKKPFWAERFLVDDRYRYRFIHLVRDPRAYVRRMHLRYRSFGKRVHIRRQMLAARPGWAPQLLSCSTERLYAYRWLAQNEEITGFLERHGLEASLVTYLELAQKTPEVLRRLTSEAGLVYDASQLEYWRFPHHGTQKIEYQHVDGRTPRIVDLRWREFLSRPVQDAIVNDRRIRGYLDRLGLRITKDGLEKIDGEV